MDELTRATTNDCDRDRNSSKERVERVREVVEMMKGSESEGEGEEKEGKRVG